MSTSKKSIKKRKLPSSPSQTTLQANRRLEVLRSGQRNLWDDDDNDDSDLEPYVKLKKPTTINKTYIVISDSDNEKTSSRRRSKSNKSKKKSSRTCDESLTSDNDHKRTSKCVTCLICSILTTLTSYNCCSKHLSSLINNKNSHDNDQKQTINTNQWPPKQVMIVPVTDELIQRYINPQEFVHIKTSTSPIHKKSVRSNRSIRKLSKKSRITSESSDAEHSIINKIKSSTKSSRVELEQPNSSSIVIESVLPTNSGKISQDATYTVITSTSTSTSTTVNSFESPNILDTCQIQQSSDQLITIDDSQPNTQQDDLLTHNTQKNQTNDPWTPISDDTYVAIETTLHRIDSSSQEKHEFTPITARRTPTDLMASHLPKIQLKKGRFHQGKPIVDKNVSDTTTNGCQSSTICQSSSSSSTSTSTSIIITNNRPAPSSLETIIEDESLVIQSTHQISDKSAPSCHGLSQQPENTTEGLSDTVMSCLFAQDELSQYDNIHITTKTISNEAVLPPPPPPLLLLPTIIIEDYSHKNDINNKSVDISQSSQLTNDQTDFQQLTPSTTNEKPTGIARRSYRMNADGSRVSISRSSISTYRQSSSTSLRRLSNDVTSTTSRTKK
ncbi:unnamed protein product [Rotaria sordida]|uniref:Uncharacterized protein n=1 Tax=Rotaria sordida TaxID=392033 RepID=A0A815GAS1_9BILA|nr:unnamed protein product [Rotaria sordida]